MESALLSCVRFIICVLRVQQNWFSITICRVGSERGRMWEKGLCTRSDGYICSLFRRIFVFTQTYLRPDSGATNMRRDRLTCISFVRFGSLFLSFRHTTIPPIFGRVLPSHVNFESRFYIQNTTPTFRRFVQRESCNARIIIMITSI